MQLPGSRVCPCKRAGVVIPAAPPKHQRCVVMQTGRLITELKIKYLKITCKYLFEGLGLIT